MFTKVKKLKVKVEPLPHIGWNNVTLKKDSILFNGLDEINDFYFVHSYFPKPTDESIVATRTTYGESFASAAWRDNVFAAQFHPEFLSRPNSSHPLFKGFVAASLARRMSISEHSNKQAHKNESTTQ